MATVGDVQRTLRSLLSRFDPAGARGTLPSGRSIVCVVPDLDVAYRAIVEEGRIVGPARVPAANGADVVVRVASDDLVALADGSLSLGMALATGRLRVGAGPRDLLLLRRLF